MDGRGKVVAMSDDVAAPRVKVIETSYVTISDPSQFKSVVQSLTGAQEVKKAAGSKRALVDANFIQEASAHVAGVAAISSKNQDKRQRSSSGCGGSGDLYEPFFSNTGSQQALLKKDSFKEEIYAMMVPESPLPSLEDQLEWLFSDEER